MPKQTRTVRSKFDWFVRIIEIWHSLALVFKKSDDRLKVNQGSVTQVSGQIQSLVNAEKIAAFFLITSDISLCKQMEQPSETSTRIYPLIAKERRENREQGWNGCHRSFCEPGCSSRFLQNNDRISRRMQK